MCALPTVFCCICSMERVIAGCSFILRTNQVSSAIPQRYCDSCVCVLTVAQFKMGWRLSLLIIKLFGHIKAWMGLGSGTNMTAVYRNFHTDCLDGRSLSSYYLPSCSAFFFSFFIAYNCVKLVTHTLKTTKRSLVSLTTTRLKTSLRLVQSLINMPPKNQQEFLLNHSVLMLRHLGCSFFLCLSFGILLGLKLIRISFMCGKNV